MHSATEWNRHLSVVWMLYVTPFPCMSLWGVCMSWEQWNAFTLKQLLTLASLSASMMPPVCSCSSAYALCRAWYSFVSCRNRSSDSSAAKPWRIRKDMSKHQPIEQCQSKECKCDLLSTILGLQVLIQTAFLVSLLWYEVIRMWNLYSIYMSLS